jgi:hypothetical protein
VTARTTVETRRTRTEIWLVVEVGIVNEVNACMFLETWGRQVTSFHDFHNKRKARMNSCNGLALRLAFRFRW